MVNATEQLKDAFSTLKAITKLYQIG